MNMMKVNVTHVHAIYEQTEVLQYFKFAAQGLILFLLTSVSHILGKAMQQFGINIIHL